MDQSKNAYRACFRQTLSPERREALALQALEALRRWAVYQQASLIATFSSLPWEMDMTLINRGMWADGKRLCFPRITGPGRMCFCLAPDENALIPGAYGISEPPGYLSPVSPPSISLMLTPCEALDRYGTRLGKGGGYYDRYLSGYIGPTAALLLPHQWAVQPLPRQKHDQPIAFYGLNGQIYPTERKFLHAEQEEKD